jgi:hypothetical protein
VPLFVYGDIQEVLNAIGARGEAGSYLVDRPSVLLR